MQCESVSNAPLMNCACGTVSVSAGSSAAHEGNAPKKAPFTCVSSLVMTAPLFCSAPVPESVTMQPMGMNELGILPSACSNVSMSSSSIACAETTLQQSKTDPPPTARMKSTCSSRASAAPS